MFNWLEYLNLAQYLYELNASTVNQESALRSCVSRAYYAVFCEIRNRAVNIGFSIYKNSDDHQRLISYLMSRNSKLANALKDLRIWRNKCDYDDQVENLDQLAKNSLDKATRIIQSQISS